MLLCSTERTVIPEHLQRGRIAAGSQRRLKCVTLQIVQRDFRDYTGCDVDRSDNFVEFLISVRPGEKTVLRFDAALDRSKFLQNKGMQGADSLAPALVDAAGNRNPALGNVQIVPREREHNAAT